MILFATGITAKIYLLPDDAKLNFITSKAKITTLEHTILADGVIKASKQVSVGAQVSGQVKILHIALGEHVTKGQLIAEIDDLTQQNTLRDALATLEDISAKKAGKEATLSNNKITLERQKKLMETGVGIQADYDTAKSQVTINEAEIRALQAQINKAQVAVDTAKLNLGYTKITSPIDGVIVAISVEEGQTVNAVQSAPTIAKVAQLNIMTIEAQISEADVPKVTPGSPIYFTILGEPNHRYTANLRAIEPAPTSINDDVNAFGQPQSSGSTAIYYNGLFDVPNPDGKLRISMTAQVYIVLGRTENAIVVPSSAIKKDKETNRITVDLLVGKNQIISKEIEIGIDNKIYAEILSGVDAGEEVIIGQSEISDSLPKLRLRM